MKKILVLLLAVLMLVPVSMFGCGEKAGDKTTLPTATTNVPEDTREVPDIPPESNFGEYEFKVLIQDGMQEDMWTEETEKAEPLHDAVFARNRKMEEQLGIKISVTTETVENMRTKIKSCFQTGTDEYDVYFVHMVEGTSLALQGCFLPFEKLTYVDLEKPYWDKSIKNGFSIQGNQLMANGDISPSSFKVTSCLFFNKKLFDRYDITYPYQDVKDNKWTMDKYIEITRDLTRDNTGDSVVRPGDADLFSLTSWWLDVPYSMYYACGGMLIKKDETDTPSFDLNVETNYNIVLKIYDALITNEAVYEQVDFPSVCQRFMDGNAFFYDAKLANVDTIREMDDDFGILPLPKYDEKQTDYYSFVNGCANMVAVPSVAKDAERTSIILEALACESYNEVTPVLYEILLKRKATRDEQSSEMIDYVVRNRVFDMGYSMFHGSIGSFVRDLMAAKKTDVASTFKRGERAALRELQKNIDTYEQTLE